MLTAKSAFSGFSVSNLAAAKEFYSGTLGLPVEEGGMGLKLQLPGGAAVFVYQKKDHQPAMFTILNFVVENIDSAVEELAKSGIQLERYEGMAQDEKGIMRGIAKSRGPDIAWFTDPSGNILSVLQEGE